jgi:hypothetical protein
MYHEWKEWYNEWYKEWYLVAREITDMVICALVDV